MASKKASSKKKSTPGLKKPSFKFTRQQKVITGSFLMFLGLALIIAFTSFLFNWEADQSILGQLGDREVGAKNWLSKFGAAVSDFFIYRGFGLAAYILAILITTSGIYLFFNLKYSKLFSFWFWGILIMLWLAIFFGFFTGTYTILGGRVGYEINDYLQDYIGFIGTILLLGFLLIAYVVIRLKITPEMIGDYLKSGQKSINEDFARKEPVAKVTSEEKEWVEKAVIVDKSTPLSKTIPEKEIPK